MKIDNALHGDTIRFRPPSKEHFSKYSRHLAWLIQEKYQKTQELLARIYGYSDYHELRIELDKPGQFPGPYDDKNINELLASVDEPNQGTRITERGIRVLRIIAEHKGVDIVNLDLRFREAVNIGLFKKPGGHGKDFKAVRYKLDSAEL